MCRIVVVPTHRGSGDRGAFKRQREVLLYLARSADVQMNLPYPIMLFVLSDAKKRLKNMRKYMPPVELVGKLVPPGEIDIPRGSFLFWRKRSTRGKSKNA